MKSVVVFSAAALAAMAVPSVAHAATSIEFGTNSSWQWNFGAGAYSTVLPVNPANLLTNGTYRPALPGSSWVSSGERNAQTGHYNFKGILTLSEVGGNIQDILLRWRSDNFVKSMTVNGVLVYNYTGTARNEFGVQNPFESSFATSGGELFKVGGNEFIVTVGNRDSGSNLRAIDPVSLNMTILGSAVPEPGTWLLMILGLGAVGFAMRRQQANSVRFQFA